MMHLFIAFSVLWDFFVAMPSRMLSDQLGGEVDTAALSHLSVPDVQAIESPQAEN